MRCAGDDPGKALEGAPMKLIQRALAIDAKDIRRSRWRAAKHSIGGLQGAIGYWIVR